MSDAEVLDLVKAADAIFLDDNMPDFTGERLPTMWTAQVDFTNKRVIGISASPQSYVEEQFFGYLSVEQVRLFLGLA